VTREANVQRDTVDADLRRLTLGSLAAHPCKAIMVGFAGIIHRH
jgi:hypothetical protein